jgi:hypothetical protein
MWVGCLGYEFRLVEPLRYLFRMKWAFGETRQPPADLVWPFRAGLVRCPGEIILNARLACPPTPSLLRNWPGWRKMTAGG